MIGLQLSCGSGSRLQALPVQICWRVCLSLQQDFGQAESCTTSRSSGSCAGDPESSPAVSRGPSGGVKDTARAALAASSESTGMRLLVRAQLAGAWPHPQCRSSSTCWSARRMSPAKHTEPGHSIAGMASECTVTYTGTGSKAGGLPTGCACGRGS